MDDPRRITDGRTPGAGTPPPGVTPRTSTGHSEHVPTSPWQQSPPLTSDSGPERGPGDAVTDERLKRIKKLGEGGYGEVWLVEYLGALEAHKYLKRRSSAEREAFREAVNTRAVDHPNVVKVVDILEDEDGPILRMEYVDGTNLAAIVAEDGIFPVERLIPIAIQVADALRAAHERGIVHLDLKPSNLILRKDGRSVVVTDFGISAALRPSEGELSGGRGGTPFFMAPELHAKGGKGTPRSDIWSLGVTLYYLASGSYPFQFEELSPSRAVAKPPRPIHQTHRYVSPEFGQILARMLAQDPEQRFASMVEVKKALEEYAYSVACPRCGQFFRFESISGVCPDPGCQAPDVVSAKAALLARRGAETALAECSFDEAVAGFKVAKQKYGDLDGSEAAQKEIDQLVRAVHGLETDHANSVANAQRLFDNQRYIECVHRTHEAAYRFSRSHELHRLRLATRNKLVALHDETPGDVQAAIRSRAFDEARELLTRLDHVLSDVASRGELVAALGTDPKEFGWLYQQVDTQQEQFIEWTRAGESALARFDFKSALDAFTQLESSFPSDEYRELVAAISRGESAFEAATAYGEDLLRTLADDPSSAGASRRLDLDHAQNACRALLEDFPIDEHSNFETIAERSALLERTSESLRAFVNRSLEKAQQARKSTRPFEERELLVRIKDLVARCDLFDANTRELVLERLRETDRAAGEAESRYREGTEARDRREFARAQNALQQVLAIAPDTYPELPQMLEDIAHKLTEIQELRVRLAEDFSRIDRGEFDLAFAKETLGWGERLYGLLDDRQRRSRAEELARIVAILLASQQQHLAQLAESDADADGDVVAFLYANLIPVVQSLDLELWRVMVEQSKELNRALCGLFQAAEPRNGQGCEVLLGKLRARAELIENDVIGPVMREVRPPAGSSHPAERLATLAAEAFKRERWDKRNLLYESALGTVERLRRTCPDDVSPEVQVAERDLRRAGRQGRVAAVLSRASGLVKTAAPVAALAVVGMLAGYLIRDVVAAEDSFAGLAEQLEVGPAQADEVRAWLASASDETERDARESALRAWRWLVANRTAEPEVLTATLVVAARQRHVLTDEPPLDSDLVGSFDDRLEQALGTVLENVFDVGAEAFRGRMGTDGVAFVSSRLATLRSALGAGPDVADMLEPRLFALEIAELRSGAANASVDALLRAIDERRELEDGSARAYARFVAEGLRGALVARLETLATRATLGDVDEFSTECPGILEKLARLAEIAELGPLEPRSGDEIHAAVVDAIEPIFQREGEIPGERR